MKTALLLSGGMHSVAIAWWRRPNIAITIDYGQLPAEQRSAPLARSLRRSKWALHRPLRLVGAPLRRHGG